MASTQSEIASKGVAVAVVTNNKDPDKLCRVKVRIRGTTKRPRPTGRAWRCRWRATAAVWCSFPKWVTRSWSPSSAGIFAFPTCWVRFGMTKPSRRSQTPMARTTSGCSRRARGISCCSMTAGTWRRRGRACRRPADRAGRRWHPRRGRGRKPGQDRECQRHDQHPGQWSAEDQGGDDLDRSDKRDGSQGQRNAQRSRRPGEHQLGVMGQPAARVGDMTSHGTPLAPGPGCPTVLVAGLPAWRVTGDFHTCPLAEGVRSHVGGTVAVGSTTVTIGGMHAARQGDAIVESAGPNVIIGGATTVLIG